MGKDMEVAHAGERLDLSKYDILAFDMDMTLARYKLEPLHELVFMFLVESVERQLGIRIDAKDKVYVKQFARRAEIFDTEHGNIVILNKVGQVCEAMHGTKKQLSGQEIEQIYGKDRQYVNWESARKCERNPHHETFLSDFLSPCYLVLALIVDYCPEKEYYKRGLQAVMTALDDHFGPANFAAKTGSFFPAMQANPRKFLHKLTQEELSFLTTMRSRGKKIFLMTNSKRDFAELVMQTVIGNDWTEHFDFILTSSQKPHFFTRPDGFESAQGKSYTKGSLRALREVHPEINSRVLYFGDDIRTDILPTSTLVQWDNVALIPELADPEDARGLLECEFQKGKPELTYFGDILEKKATFVAPSFEDFVQKCNQSASALPKARAIFDLSTL